jgi:Raf kinase inhibitor-like YbhB/YbcL family protein
MRYAKYALLTATAAALAMGGSTRAWDEQFTLSSTTFQNDETLPLSTIANISLPNGLNGCSINGAAGGDTSPELSWSHAPWGTRSFVVVLYDETAAFTHWGMYNISGKAHGLPQNAGAAGSTDGQQINNDFGTLGYEGPCPPADDPPDTHRYRFTVYALSSDLRLPASANFPANSETLYHALIEAGRRGEILGSASLLGLYSTTP